MMKYKKISVLAIFICMSTYSNAQDSLSQDLYFIKKGRQPLFNEKKDYFPSRNGFYIYRNCIYDLVLKNKLLVSAKIIDIKNDSIYYTAYINDDAAEKNKANQDTFSIHPSSIRS